MFEEMVMMKAVELVGLGSGYNLASDNAVLSKRCRFLEDKQVQLCKKVNDLKKQVNQYVNRSYIIKLIANWLYIIYIMYYD